MMHAGTGARQEIVIAAALAQPIDQRMQAVGVIANGLGHEQSEVLIHRHSAT